MNDLIRKEQISGQKVVVGDKYHDIVLRTLGKVYIQSGQNMTLLNDLIKNAESSKDNNCNQIINISTEEDLKTLKYPGSGYFVFVQDSQNLYISTNEMFIPVIGKSEQSINWKDLYSVFLAKSGGVVNGKVQFERPISITSETSPLNIKSQDLVKNLNSEYLNGEKGENFAIKTKDQVISGQWDFENWTKFNDKTYFKDDIISAKGFFPGFSGYGWKLDSKTNTLTIDNLVVRKMMNVYELVVNKISATNGSLWVSDSLKVEKVEKINYKTVYYFGQDANGGDLTIVIHSSSDYDGDGESDVNIDVGDPSVYFPEGFTLQYFNVWESTENDLICDGLDKNGDYIQVGDPAYDNRIKLNINTFILDASDPDNLKRVYLYNDMFKGDFYKIYPDDIPTLRVNDIARVQKYDKGNVKMYHCIVTATTSDYIIVRLEEMPGDYEPGQNQGEYPPDWEGDIPLLDSSQLEDAANVQISVPEVGDGLVRIGNIDQKNRQGAIYLTSSDQGAPFIEIRDGVFKTNYGEPTITLIEENGEEVPFESRPRRCRLGNLDGIYDPAFGKQQPRGMGAYLENAYIKGRIVQVDPDGSERPPVIYKGQWDISTTYYENNQVLHKGALWILTSYSSLGDEPGNPDSPWDEAATGGLASTVTLGIHGEMYFNYKNQFKEFLGPSSITLKLTPDNVDFDNLKWYVKNNESLIDLNQDGLKNIIIYPFEDQMVKKYGPLTNMTYWDHNSEKITIVVSANLLEYDLSQSFDIINTSTGEDAYTLFLESSNGLTFHAGKIFETSIKARVFKGGDEIIDDHSTLFKYYWSKATKDGVQDDEWNKIYNPNTGLNTNKIIITSEDIYRKSTFFCNISEIKN